MENWFEVYDLADNYKNQEQWQQAAQAFKRATELNPDSFWSYHHLGDVLGKLQRWQQAKTAYSRAVQLDADFFWSWHNLGSACGHLQLWQQAEAAYSRAVQLDADFFWSWHNLGNALAEQQEWDRAISCYFQAILLKPEHQLVYQKLAIAFRQRASLLASIQYYRQLISSPQADSIFSTLKEQPQKLLEIANILEEKHQTVAAIVIFYIILEIQPQQSNVLQRLTLSIKEHDKLEQNLTSTQQHLENVANVPSSQLLSRINAKPISQTKTKYPTGKIILDTNCLVLPNQIENLCLAVGWQPRPKERVELALKQSFTYVCAWYIYDNGDKQMLIGFARAVSDGAFNAMLLDIVVHPDFQGQGIGKRVVENLLAQLHRQKIQDITLIASPHMIDFYHKLGFVSQPHNLQWMLFVDR